MRTTSRESVTITLTRRELVIVAAAVGRFARYEQGRLPRGERQSERAMRLGELHQLHDRMLAAYGELSPLPGLRRALDTL